jgi:MFS family permease
MHRDARRWLLASALLGFGQQLFVVLRNPFVHDLGFPLWLLGWLQGVGAVMGVLAGMAGLWLSSRVSSAWMLRAGALANAAGFVTQVTATHPWQFILGAALAGVGIQLLTMSSGPFLARRVTARDRVRVYGLQVIAIQTLPGLLGAVLGGELQRIVAADRESSLDGYRVALASGAASVALSLLPLRGLAAEEPAGREGGALHAKELRRFVGYLVPDVLLQFGAGLAVPFLQVYLHVMLNAPTHHVGRYFGAMMLAGTLGNLLLPVLARRIGSARALAALFAGAAVGFVGLALAATVKVAALALVLRYSCSVAANSLWTGALHAAVDPRDGESLASWRMIVQSIAWAAANLLAGAALTQGADALRGLLFAAALVQGVASWGAWRALTGEVPRRDSCCPCAREGR